MATINRVLVVVALQLVAVHASNNTNSTAAPTAAPTVSPTVAPTAAACVPTAASNSSNGTTCAPTVAPTAAPTATAPTAAPTAAAAPTVAPTAAAGGGNGTTAPTVAPTAAAAPTVAPTAAATGTACVATANTTCNPTAAPTAAPTAQASTPSPTPAPVSGNSTPTAAPTAAAAGTTQVEKVVIEVTVQNVDFSGLSANASLMTSFKSACAESFAASAGVAKSAVMITVTAASVKVKAEITPPAGTTATALKATVSAKTNVGSTLATKLNAVSGLSAVVSGGTLSVTTPVYTTVTVTVSAGANATTTELVESGPTANGAAPVKIAMGAIAAAMLALVEL